MVGAQAQDRRQVVDQGLVQQHELQRHHREEGQQRDLILQQMVFTYTHPTQTQQTITTSTGLMAGQPMNFTFTTCQPTTIWPQGTILPLTCKFITMATDTISITVKATITSTLFTLNKEAAAQVQW